MSKIARTHEEINQQIEGLLEMKKTLPEYSFFGDNNWKSIDIQVDVLKGNISSNDITDDDFYNSAVDAENWLDGSCEENLYE